MYAVTAVYPSGHIVLIGFASSKKDVDGLIADVLAANGGEDAIKERGIKISVELAI